MKKRLLIGTALFAAVSAFPQSGRTVIPKAGVRDFLAEKAQIRSIGVNEPQISPMIGAGLTKKGNLNYMRSSASQAATTVSWDLLCGSMNVYGMLVPTSRPLQYNPNVNAVSFIHRKSATYQTNPPLPTSAEAGVIVAEVSTNWGTTWDSTAIWADATHWGRYPQGGIWAPPATTFSNAYVVGTGPVVSGSTWTGDFYASKQLNTFDNVASTVPGAQQFISFTPTNPAIAPHGWSRNGFSATDDGLVRSVAIIEDDFQGLSTVTGFAVVTGSFNSGTGTFDWSTETLIPNTMQKPDGTNYLSPDPQMAWSQDGNIGYVVASGVVATATQMTRSFQPIVWKMDRTLSSTPTWTQVPEIDFNLPTYSIVTNYLAGQIAMNGDTISLPFLNEYDITVDKFGKLHVGAIFMSGATDHPDSLNYYSQWSAHNNPGELYKWRHSPGNRPYIYDMITDGSSGWHIMMIDSMSSEGPSSAVGYPGYTENPWDNTGDGGAKVTLESRLQLGRTPDGEYITVSWAESDSAFTNMQLKWNNLPDIKIRAIRANGPTDYSVNIGPEQNMTGNDNDVFTRATLHYMSPTTGTATVLTNPTTGYTVNINTPLTVTNSNPYSQLTNNTTWYGAANVEYQFPHSISVGVANASKKVAIGHLYPNPATGSAVYSTVLDQAVNFDIAVLNTVGQTVKQVTAPGQVGENKVQIDLSGLSSGIYFVNVKAGTLTSTKKLIVK